MTPAAVSLEETARILGIGRSSAYRLARTGEIPTVRLGKRLVVPTAWITRTLDAAIAEWDEAS